MHFGTGDFQANTNFVTNMFKPSWPNPMTARTVGPFHVFDRKSICRGIYKRNPIKPGINFINSVDSLFCYTKISNSGPKQEIKHIWYLEDIEMTSVAYNIKPSFNYRSWSRKTIYPNQTGQWRVDVVDFYGNILGTRDFTIKSISSTY